MTYMNGSPRGSFRDSACCQGALDSDGHAHSEQCPRMAALETRRKATRDKPAPKPKTDTERLVAAFTLFVLLAFTDAWVFMLLVDGLNAAWFPHLPTLGYWQAFLIIVPALALVRSVLPLRGRSR